MSAAETPVAHTGPSGRARRAWQFFLPLAIFAVLVGFFYRGLFLNPREVPSALIDKPVPAFSLARLDDPKRVFAPQDMQGKVWLLNVWGSWCVSCRYEHPILNELARTAAVPVVGLNWKDEREAALAWLAKYGDPYLLSVQDALGRTAIDLGVYGAPETFVVDKAGVIRYKHTGPLDAKTLEAKVLPVVREWQGR